MAIGRYLAGETGASVYWRATVDEDGHYCFAISL
jgi:hypothetical protein